MIIIVIDVVIGVKINVFNIECEITCGTAVDSSLRGGVEVEWNRRGARDGIHVSFSKGSWCCRNGWGGFLIPLGGLRFDVDEGAVFGEQFCYLRNALGRVGTRHEE